MVYLYAELTTRRVTQTDPAGTATKVTQLSDAQFQIREGNMRSSDPTGGQVTMTDGTVKAAELKYLGTKTTAAQEPPAVCILSLES
jgi:hypothetical protein